jgi:hypothetical protein
VRNYRFVGAVSAFFCTVAMAAPAPINLSPMQGEKAVSIDQTQAFTGSCGSAVVRVTGVQDVRAGYFSADVDAEVIIRADMTHELRLNTIQGGLSDINGLSCVSTKAGKRLLVWNGCNGNSAACEKFSFLVIDPERLAILAPRDIVKDQCDEQCASQLLGNRLPQQINRR